MYSQLIVRSCHLCGAGNGHLARALRQPPSLTLALMMRSSKELDDVTLLGKAQGHEYCPRMLAFTALPEHISREVEIPRGRWHCARVCLGVLEKGGCWHTAKTDALAVHQKFDEYIWDLLNGLWQCPGTIFRNVQNQILVKLDVSRLDVSSLLRRQVMVST